MSRRLFTVIDPTKDQQPALQRAAVLAPLLGAEVVAFCCVYQEDISQFTSKHDAKHTTLKNAKELTEKFTQPLSDKGIKVSIDTCWNQKWYQPAVSASAKHSADIFLLNSSIDGKGHLLETNSDRHILRNAPCPVLLCAPTDAIQYNRLLASVAIEKQDDDHVRLNHRIVSIAQLLRNACHASLDLLTATSSGINIAQALNTVIVDDQTDASLLAETFGIDENRAHVVLGNAKQVIPEFVEKEKSDLLVIGTIARKGISAAVLGNTAESIVKQLSIDILVVN